MRCSLSYEILYTNVTFWIPAYYSQRRRSKVKRLWCDAILNWIVCGTCASEIRVIWQIGQLLKLMKYGLLLIYCICSLCTYSYSKPRVNKRLIKLGLNHITSSLSVLILFSSNVYAVTVQDQDWLHRRALVYTVSSWTAVSPSSLSRRPWLSLRLRSAVLVHVCVVPAGELFSERPHDVAVLPPVRLPIHAPANKSNQWCIGKFGAGGTLGGLGTKPPAGSRGSPPNGPSNFFTFTSKFVNSVNHSYFKLRRTNRRQWFTLTQLFH